MLVDHLLVEDIKGIILNSKKNAIRAIDSARTMMYWLIGKRISEEEHTQHKAGSGNALTKLLAAQLEPEYGSSFSNRQLQLFRQFYKTFPNANTVY